MGEGGVTLMCTLTPGAPPYVTNDQRAVSEEAP
jgi:hypothetical protein